MESAGTATALDGGAVEATLDRLFTALRRLSDLAVREGVTQPAMTQLVSRLERDGLVR